MFLHEKDGYNKKQVNTKIESMHKELTNLKRSLEEKDKLNLGLATALEKSKEIEASTFNLYELKIKKILILYRNLAKSFNTLFTLYPQIEELDDIKKSFDTFAQTVENTFLRNDDQKTINSAVNTENDTIRLLLDKVSTYQPPVDVPVKPKPVNIKRKDSRPPEKLQISSKLNIDTSIDGFESPAEKFLQTGATENNAYAKILNHKNPNDLYPEPNESGFDLKEAVNPKSDLDEIMKAFNFD